MTDINNENYEKTPTTLQTVLNSKNAAFFGTLLTILLAYGTHVISQNTEKGIEHGYDTTLKAGKDGGEISFARNRSNDPGMLETPSVSNELPARNAEAADSNELIQNN